MCRNLNKGCKNARLVQLLKDKLNISAQMVFSSLNCYTYYNNLFWRGLTWRKPREGKLKILFYKQILKKQTWSDLLTPQGP